MTKEAMSVEDQLRQYADAIDPSRGLGFGASAVNRRVPSVKATWLSAAAALLLVVGIAAISQRDRVQDVETVPFVQAPEDSANIDGTAQSTFTPERTEPIFWPGGSTDPVVSVERFMDLSFPQWRADGPMIMVAPVADDMEPMPGDEIVVEIRHDDGAVFASVPLRFADGRWFLEEISGPLMELDLTRQLSSNQMQGSVIVEMAGELQIDLVYPAERTIESSTTITITEDQVGMPIPIGIDQSHQEVHATLMSPTNELLAVAAFTAQSAFPSAPPAGSETTDGCPGCVPLPDDVPPTGDWRTREESLVVMMAQFVLTSECMADQGLVNPMPTDQEWVELLGSWRPSGVLGIGTEGAARTIGYQDAGWGGAGSPTQAESFNVLSQQERDAYGSAVQGCWRVTEAALGDNQNREIAFDAVLQFGSDETQRELSRSDPLLAGAIEDWQDCIREATGIEADTPNTLARQFAFAGTGVTDREREIAVADVQCQQATRLEESFFLARTKQLRSELGDQVEDFDNYVRFRIEILALSQQVLDDRGITPPSLE